MDLDTGQELVVVSVQWRSLNGAYLKFGSMARNGAHDDSCSWHTRPYLVARTATSSQILVFRSIVPWWNATESLTLRSGPQLRRFFSWSNRLHDFSRFRERVNNHGRAEVPNLAAALQDDREHSICQGRIFGFWLSFCRFVLLHLALGASCNHSADWCNKVYTTYSSKLQPRLCMYIQIWYSIQNDKFSRPIVRRIASCVRRYNKCLGTIHVLMSRTSPIHAS
jgi:hypothetical protein